MKIKCFKNDCENHSLLYTDRCSKRSPTLFIDDTVGCYDYKHKEE